MVSKCFPIYIFFLKELHPHYWALYNFNEIVNVSGNTPPLLTVPGISQHAQQGPKSNNSKNMFLTNDIHIRIVHTLKPHKVLVFFPIFSKRHSTPINVALSHKWINHVLFEWKCTFEIKVSSKKDLQVNFVTVNVHFIFYSSQLKIVKKDFYNL